MTILLLLIPLSLLLVGVAAWAFAWAVRGGQFDDLDTPALDILGEDQGDAGAGTLPDHDPDTGTNTNTSTNTNTNTDTDTDTDTDTTTTTRTTITHPDAD